MNGLLAEKSHVNKFEKWRKNQFQFDFRAYSNSEQSIEILTIFPKNSSILFLASFSKHFINRTEAETFGREFSLRNIKILSNLFQFIGFD